jgi:YD repeat-containing protein
MFAFFKASAMAALAGAVFLSACGGGGDDASATPTGKFGSTDQAAGTAAGLIGAGGTLTFAAELVGKSTAKTTRGGFGSRQFAVAKATTTENCAESGSVTFVDDTTTTFGEDGTAMSNACRESFADGNGRATFTTSGRVADKCTDSAQTASVCNASTVRLADGAAGSATFDVAFTNTNTADRTDLTLKAKGDLVTSTSGSTENSTLSATLSVTDRVLNANLTAGFSDFRSSYTSASNGTATETLNGRASISSSKANCNVGAVTIATRTPLRYDSSGMTTAGELTMTDASNQTVRVSYNADGSATITMPDGQTRTYSEAQLESLCE